MLTDANRRAMLKVMIWILLLRKKGIFTNLAEKLKDHNYPSWLAFDITKNECKVQGAPKLTAMETNFDSAAVLNFYSG